MAGGVVWSGGNEVWEGRVGVRELISQNNLNIALLV